MSAGLRCCFIDVATHPAGLYRCVDPASRFYTFCSIALFNCPLFVAEYVTLALSYLKKHLVFTAAYPLQLRPLPRFLYFRPFPRHFLHCRRAVGISRWPAEVQPSPGHFHQPHFGLSRRALFLEGTTAVGGVRAVWSRKTWYTCTGPSSRTSNDVTSSVRSYV